jgi:hypothetical protein
MNLDSYCPTCAAAPGYDCIEKGRVVLPHKAREESAESLQRAADYVYALHILEEAALNAQWSILLGDGRN